MAFLSPLENIHSQRWDEIISEGRDALVLPYRMCLRRGMVPNSNFGDI